MKIIVKYEGYKLKYYVAKINNQSVEYFLNINIFNGNSVCDYYLICNKFKNEFKNKVKGNNSCFRSKSQCKEFIDKLLVEMVIKKIQE